MKNSITQELPRERCIEHGAEVLSLRECLALLIGTGTKEQDCIQVADSLLRTINPANPSDETSFFTHFEASQGVPPNLDGLGPAKSARIQCAFELARRYHVFCEMRARNHFFAQPISLEKNLEKKIPQRLYRSSQEWIGFIPILASGKLCPLVVVEKGTRTEVNFDPCELFRRILTSRASGIYLFHFHPSGCDNPSHSDILVTRKIRQILLELQIYFYGHWIVTPGGLSLIKGSEYDITDR